MRKLSQREIKLVAQRHTACSDRAGILTGGHALNPVAQNKPNVLRAATSVMKERWILIENHRSLSQAVCDMHSNTYLTYLTQQIPPESLL